MIIGITGTDGAGKGTAVDYLVNTMGFRHFSSREVITAEIEKRGLVATRENLRIVANDMRATEGNDVLVKRALATIKADGVRDAVIESIRALAEAETLQASGGVLLAVDADQTIRYQRICARGSSSDQVTFEEFVAQEAIEMNDPNPHGMQKGAVMERADYTVTNESSVDNLHHAVERFLKLQHYGE